jgi:ABC-type arginine/histidine transport system permease subunit
VTAAKVTAIIKATPRGCSVAHLTTETCSIPAEVMRAALEAIADGEVEAFWRDPARRIGLMLRGAHR